MIALDCFAKKELKKAAGMFDNFVHNYLIQFLHPLFRSACFQTLLFTECVRAFAGPGKEEHFFNLAAQLAFPRKRINKSRRPIAIGLNSANESNRTLSN